MILGIDITSIAEWEARLRRTPRTAALAFSAAELRASGGDPAFLALAWALKESVAKSFGTGFAGIGWRAVELLAIDASAVTVRAAFGSTAQGGLASGWRADFVTDGDRVVAAVVASRAPLKLSSRLMALDREGGRRQRSVQLSRAARTAAGGAARELLGADQVLDWGRTSRGAPLLRCRAGGPAIGVSLAHGGGAAVALVAVAGDGGAAGAAFAGEPVAIELALDREVLRGVRAGQMSALACPTPHGKLGGARGDTASRSVTHIYRKP
ncbi:MAG: 4'-phosphopantetheinyl transferase superfamily protein [Chloroflexi bacterium]|nr:4'-phosphopantetheinyl transferase superfamily protein [Chloroflexota bacterium]